MQLNSMTDPTPDSCEDFPLKIKIPAAISHYTEFKNFTYFAYCIPLKINLHSNVDWGLFLGFIDNEHRIFLNVKLISSTES